MSAAGAFFDLDRTLVTGSTGMQFGRAAARGGLVSRRRLARWAAEHLRFRLRGSTDARTDQVLAEVKELLTEVPEYRLAAIFPDMLAGILPRLNGEVVDEVRAHQSEGRPTFIVSAAGSGVVEVLAQILAMTEGVGTRWEVGPDGAFTGEVEGPFIYGEGKVEAMRDLADRHGLDLAASWAYSDSASDLPMLRAVGNAVVVNPDAELTEIARHEGWRIIRADRLGRRIALTAGSGAALAGGAAAWASRDRLRRNGRRPRSRRPRRRRNS